MRGNGLLKKEMEQIMSKRGPGRPRIEILNELIKKYKYRARNEEPKIGE